MDVARFVEKWSRSTRSERSASQEHFYDLCELIGHPKPGDVDPKGLTFTAERHVTKASGGRGYADFVKAGFFAWEYKGKGADLNLAFNQLLQYSGDLGNPPLLIVSDMDRVEIRTHFTGFPTKTFSVTLDNLVMPEKLNMLRRVFNDPHSFQPEKTIQRITEDAAKQLSEIVPRIRQRHSDPARVAHFLNRLIFCLFAEDHGILTGNVFTKVVTKFAIRPAGKIMQDIGELFQAMASGGEFFGETIPHFNGNLFDGSPILELNALEIEVIHKAAALDWSEMDASIFGTLFERVMDPAQRSQLGAHYTGYQDIATLVEPVVMDPLRREWDACRERVESLVPIAVEALDGPTLFPKPSPKKRAESLELVNAFLSRLRTVRVLDPACGSGNFLYVALKMLKELEFDVLIFCRKHDLPEFELEVGPRQLLGIEINPYAFDLAQMTVWIGLLQWHRAKGLPYHHDPILQPLDTFQNKDAILDLTVPNVPTEPTWPEADFIVGNPPFLGDKKMRSELGDEYVTFLRNLYRDRIPGQSDLCCYWFEKARKQIHSGRCRRAGFLATQGIRGGKNRVVLTRIRNSGSIFFAQSDRPWVLDGANVHISMVGFDDGSETRRELNGTPVDQVYANLTHVNDIAGVHRLRENSSIAYVGTTKKAPFDINARLAGELLSQPNPDGRRNSDVIIPYANGMTITQRTKDEWIIDFGDRTKEEASLYEGPFKYALTHVFPLRERHREKTQMERWWQLARPCSEMMRRIASLPRYLVTPTVCKHRVFAWLTCPVEPDHQLYVFVRADDYFFGIVHSHLHEIWALKLGTRLETRPRYTPSKSFETFPFPEPSEAQRDAIARAAKSLDELRSNWLTPPEWHREEVLEFSGSVDGPWARFVHDADARGIGTVRYPRLVPKDAYV
ncbi:MAG: class I SAM-dependent DNA methyltransferase, partial [Planctomycetota bacterium]|nr:class I SAM-dependent DNA methyltransferase [Planctomycetota bacterium]